ncbi:unnamed protein product [Sphacelaria rigidula]
MELCRSENAVLHSVRPLDPTTTSSQRESLSVADPPMLIVVSIGAEPRLLKNEESVNAHLTWVMRQTHSLLHPKGTMVFFVPKPWPLHMHRLQGACKHGS